MKKILIGDDEPNIVELLRIAFTENGFAVVTATSGKQCLEMIRNENPDLAVLDVKMPDIGGSEVAMALKIDPKYRDLPLVFLTGLLSKDDEKIMGNEIADQVIFAKPFSVVKLVEKVRGILASRDNTAGSRQINHNPPKS